MTHKHFYVVAYDIADDRRRSKVVKVMESMGHRVNYSVFECMLTDLQYRSLCERLSRIVLSRDDQINIYPLCSECYARIRYMPASRAEKPASVVVV